MKPLFLMLFSSLTLLARAQVSVSPGTTVTLRGLMHARGHVSIDPGSSFENRLGTLELTGNLSNHGTYASSGTERFLADSQSCSGTLSGTSHLGHIVKAASGTLHMLSSVECDSLTFLTDGTIDVSDGTTLTVTSSTQDAITGFSPSRYVNVGTTGTLARTIKDTTGASYTFPVGTSFGYRDITVRAMSLGNDGAGIVSASLIPIMGSVDYSASYPSSGQGCPLDNQPWVSFSSLEESGWRLSGPAGYTYTLSSSSCLGNALPRRILACPVATEAWTDHISNVAGDSTSALCEFSDWTGGTADILGGPYQGFRDLAAASGAALLPITLIEFGAEAVEQSIRLTWSTATEFANAGFHIERSGDARSFSRITFMESSAPNGTSTTPVSYVWVDVSPLPGQTYYYRLVQEDVDGAFDTSKTVAARIKAASGLSFGPNPCSGTLFLSGLASPTRVCIADPVGQVLYDAEITPPSGTIFLPFPNGTYFVTARSSDRVHTEKILLRR